MGVPASRPSEPSPSRLSLVRPTDLPAQRFVRQPQSVRRVAGGIGGALLLLVTLLLAVPWQQSATGTGRVVPRIPENRQQVIEAPLDGRLVAWRVQEGQVVKAGDPLAELSDNDPLWLDRLTEKRESGSDAVEAAERQIRSYGAKLAAETAAKDLAVAEYDARIASLRRRLVGEQAELDVADINATRLRTLAEEGIASSRDFELATLARDKAVAAVRAREQEIGALAQARDKAAADADAKIASVEAELDASRTKLAEVRQKGLELAGNVSRQSSQLVTAPRDGIVLAVHGGPGGGQVKLGDPLVTLVPQTTDRAVELYIDGNDMPWVRPGEQVRLLFEGWPALQFVGLPGGATGTYAGLVSWVDAADDGKGRFRVVVVPDPDEAPWPDPQRLRQGVRAKGFVLLGRVRLGYEVWRQINGFPPLPVVEEGEKPDLPTQKKPRAPSELR